MPKIIIDSGELFVVERRLQLSLDLSKLPQKNRIKDQRESVEAAVDSILTIRAEAKPASSRLVLILLFLVYFGLGATICNVYWELRFDAAINAMISGL